MILGIAVAVFLLTAILVLSVRIQTITVSGSSRYSAQQAEELLFSGRMHLNGISIFKQIHHFGVFHSIKGRISAPLPPILFYCVGSGGSPV